MKIRKNIQYKFNDKRVDLLLIGEGEKSTMPLTKILTLHRGRKHYFRYFSQAFRKAIWNNTLKTVFKINGKQTIKMSKRWICNIQKKWNNNNNKVAMHDLSLKVY